jgi:hypothetical protein
VRTRDEPEEEGDQIIDDSEQTDINIDQSLVAGVNQEHPAYKDCAAFAKELDFVYRQEILEILNLYGLSHESDLWCRNSTAGISGELEDTAYTELEQLVVRTRNRFFYEQIRTCETYQCSQDTSVSKLCNTCRKRQQAITVACYIGCYGGDHALEEAPILSLPWLFAGSLLQDRLNQEPPASEGLLSIAIKKALNHCVWEKRRLILSDTKVPFRMSKSSRVIEATIDLTVCVFIEVLQQYLGPKKYPPWPLILSRAIQMTPSFSPLPNQPNLSDEWRLALESHEVDEDNMYAAMLLSMDWTETEDQLMHQYFLCILDICFDEGRRTNDIDFLNISESIILLLQKMAINETIF